MPRFDMTKEREGNFPVYPNCTLKVVISSVKKTVSSKKGTPGIQWVASVISPEDYKGRYVSTTTYLGESSLWRIAGLIEACGLTGVPIMETESDAFMAVCQACVGRTTFWRNEQRDFEGRKSNNIVEFASDPENNVIEYSNESDVPEWAK